MSDPKVITSFDFDDLTPDEQDMVQVLNNFEFMSSRTHISLDRGDDHDIDEYLGSFMVEEKPLP